MVLRIRPTPSRFITGIRYPSMDSTSLQSRLERPTKQEVTFMLLTHGGQHRCPCVGLYGCIASIMNRACWLERILQGTSPFHCFVEFILLGHVCFSPKPIYLFKYQESHIKSGGWGWHWQGHSSHLMRCTRACIPALQNIATGAFFWLVEARV